MIHVYKFVFWNGILGFILLKFSDREKFRLWITIVFMALLGFAIVWKVILGTVYMLKFKCCANCCKRIGADPGAINNTNRIESVMKLIKPS